MIMASIYTFLLQFIKSNQNSNGSFPSFALSPDSEKTQTPLATTFITSLILTCLNEVLHLPEAQVTIDLAVNFLLSEKNSDWSWNYWHSNSMHREINLYPNDWDDTACALIALSLYKKEIITPGVLGHITKLLISTESTPGGPYYTWLLATPTNEWKDIDPVVNANIGYFLKLYNINLPLLETYIENIIASNNYTSRYYHTPESIIYFISRFYTSSLTKNLRTFLLNRQNENGLWENDLLTSLAVSSLLRTKTNKNKLTRAINHLQKIAMKNLWQAYPLYIENNKEETLYNGTPALTAAFALEALALWDKNQNKDRQVEDIQRAIIEKIKHRLTIFPEKTNNKTNILLEKILKKDFSHQITLLPYFFSQTLQSKHLISKDLLITLGEINLAGWLAYTIYDNIMDHDNSPELLSVANVCLREVIITYKEILSPEGFVLFQKLMDNMEKANAWENIYCQLPQEKIINYSKELLYKKSLPHAFGPVTILLTLGYTINSKEIQLMLSFFKNYLAARQLHDDAHDWQKDLDKDFLNSVSIPLIHLYYTHNPNLINQNSNTEKPHLQKLFWEEYIMTVAEEINEYVQNAQADLEELKQLNLIKNSNYFEKLLLPLIKSINQINSTKRDIQDFLTSFHS